MMEKKSGTTHQNLADSLAEETLQEAADTFFGQRKSIEEAMTIYERHVHQLREIMIQVQVRQSNLHAVLAEDRESGVADFYQSLGIDPEQVPWPGDQSSADLGMLSIPFALRAKRRYAKLLCSAYAQFASQARDYMHGRTYKDPKDSRRYRVTLNYDQVFALYSSIKKQIQKTNQESSPTEVLQFVKQLDVERSAKESLVGVPLRYTLDEEMAIPQPDFAASGLAAYPDLPDLDQVRDRILDWADTRYRQDPDWIKRILSQLQG
jgi:hypothetical protein